MFIETINYVDQRTQLGKNLAPNVVDVRMLRKTAQITDNETEIVLTQMKVNDLQNPIMVKINSSQIFEANLQCAYFDETDKMWLGLECPLPFKHEYKNQFAICCTTHLTKFTLMPFTFLSQRLKEETATKNSFIWMIFALVLMGLMILCCFWALYAYAIVKKRSKQTAKAKMKLAKTTEDEIGLKTNF